LEGTSQIEVIVNEQNICGREIDGIDNSGLTDHISQYHNIKSMVLEERDDDISSTELIEIGEEEKIKRPTNKTITLEGNQHLNTHNVANDNSGLTDYIDHEQKSKKKEDKNENQQKNIIQDDSCYTIEENGQRVLLTDITEDICRTDSNKINSIGTEISDRYVSDDNHNSSPTGYIVDPTHVFDINNSNSYINSSLTGYVDGSNQTTNGENDNKNNKLMNENQNVKQNYDNSNDYESNKMITDTNDISNSIYNNGNTILYN